VIGMNWYRIWLNNYGSYFETVVILHHSMSDHLFQSYLYSWNVTQHTSVKANSCWNLRLQPLINNNKAVPCMVSRPSNCHIVTLGTLRNMQDFVHIGHNDKPGTQLILRHCGLEHTSSTSSAPVTPHRPPIQPGECQVVSAVAVEIIIHWNYS